jgi:hypothetical protein
MRAICRYIFCGLAVVSFVVFVTRNLPNIKLSENALQFVVYAALVTTGLLQSPGHAIDLLKHKK